MNLAEDLWLRGQAAQRSFLELTAYNAAFFSNAAVQAVELGLSAPMVFWSSMGRAGRPGSAVAPEDGVAATAAPARLSPAQEVAAPAMPVSATVVQLHADPDTAPGPETQLAPQPAEPAVTVDAGTPSGESASPHLLDAPRGGVADDLTVLKGVGAKLAEALNEFGIYHFDQIATLDEAGIDWLNDQQPGFKMTCGRYDLVAQAAERMA